MQVGQECGHLLVVKAAGEAGHHALAGENVEPDSRVGGGSSTGQRIVLEDAVQIWWNLFEREVVFFMAVGAAHLVKVRPLSLLRGELRR